MGKWGTAFDILRDVVYGKSHFCDLYEQTALFYIFRRTWYYGKEWEFIPLRHFMGGIWSKEAGQVAPAIRISEIKLIEALKHLEAKGIIEIKRTVARASRYRIRSAHEIDEHQLIQYVFLNQEKTASLLFREMKKNRSRLSQSEVELLNEWEKIPDNKPATTIKSGSSTKAVAIAPPKKEGATLSLKEHKKPILLNRPKLQPVSLRARHNMPSLKPVPKQSAVSKNQTPNTAHGESNRFAPEKRSIYTTKIRLFKIGPQGNK